MNKIDESNFILYAAQCYDNPQCMDESEFFDDLKRFKYLKRLFNKYQESGELKERLVLNHLVVLYNLFGNEGTTRMLFFKLKNYLDILKPFLVMLERLPESTEKRYAAQPRLHVLANENHSKIVALLFFEIG